MFLFVVFSLSSVKCLSYLGGGGGGGGGGVVATQRNRKKNPKKPVPNLKFAVAFGFFGFEPSLGYEDRKRWRRPNLPPVDLETSTPLSSDSELDAFTPPGVLRGDATVSAPTLGFQVWAGSHHVKVMQKLKRKN